ncbi:MAG: hypothetical protein CMN34_07280 [Saprospirales bacterium]|nr:hypothetical protein [Saprospirales bacterium]|tara:strand:- start:2045 stop:2584 length:540 start_codon:yes stop_codon:yes gene_type:complete
MSQKESRQLELFGGKLLFETGTADQSNAGPAAYIMESQTSDKLKYSQSFHEGSGLARISADKTLQVEAGARSDNNDAGFNLTVHNGNSIITNMNGDISIQGKRITIGAHDELVLQAPKIRIGYSEQGKTSKVNIIGSQIFLEAGSLCKLRNKILYSNVFASFAGSYVSVNKWYNSLPSG